MPSQVVDDLWHEFILYTKAYDAFCGRPSGASCTTRQPSCSAPKSATTKACAASGGSACKEENIDPRQPLAPAPAVRLDTKLGIADGFVYASRTASRCRARAGNIHCGSDFSDSSIDGCTDGFADGGRMAVATAAMAAAVAVAAATNSAHASKEGFTQRDCKADADTVGEGAARPATRELLRRLPRGRWQRGKMGNLLPLHQAARGCPAGTRPLLAGTREP
jgi:hypothetical protein